MNQKVKFKMLTVTAMYPERATPRSAGFDCRADLGEAEAIWIMPGEQTLIGLGFAFEPPEGTAGFLYPRSGLGTKKGAVLANTVGVIDNDYRQEVKACIKNTGKEILTITHGERICQLVIEPVFIGDGEIVDELSETKRTGGFGSTG